MIVASTSALGVQADDRAGVVERVEVAPSAWFVDGVRAARGQMATLGSSRSTPPTAPCAADADARARRRSAPPPAGRPQLREPPADEPVSSGAMNFDEQT